MDAPKISIKPTKISIDSKKLFSLIDGPPLLENGKKNYLRITKEEMAVQKKFDQIVFPMCLDAGSGDEGCGWSSSHSIRHKHSKKPQHRFNGSRRHLGKRYNQLRTEMEELATPPKR